MPWKMDGETISMEDGNPVWVHSDGKAVGFNAESALKNLKDVTAESISRKEKIREFETKIAPFAGIENGAEYVKTANEALETVKNLDGKKLIDAGEVETLKASVAATYKEKITGMEAAFATKENDYKSAIETKDSNISNLLIKGAIGRADFIESRTVLTPSIAYDVFKGNFQIEEQDGQAKAVATRKDGTKIMSLKDPGSYAGINEALETLVNEHPDKDRLLKGVDGGGGSPPNGGGQSNSSVKYISRASWDTLGAVAQMKYAKSGGRVKD